MKSGLLHGNSGMVAFSDGFTSIREEKSKRGPRTIPDNFLEGNRNAWVQLLEESWLRVGWRLLQIRDKRSSTVEDIRKAFEPVKEMPHNSGLAASFYHQTLEPAKPTEVLKIRTRVGDLDAEIISAQAKRDEYFRSCLDADKAKKMAGPDDEGIIREEALSRLQRLLQNASDLRGLESDRETLHRKSVDQTAYVLQSELLDFLRSRRYAVSPRNLGDALAGLPGMKWRQSFERCSDMQFNLPAQEYEVFELLSEICGHLPEETDEHPSELFRAELLKRSRSFGHTRRFLRDNWRDLRLAIDECWKRRVDNSDAFPFVLSSIFIRNARRQKDAREQLLADIEKLAI
jgi:hypothetical protein